MLSLSEIQSAAERIRSFVVRTPVVPCAALSDELGCEVFFKCENLQHIGAFKARGACNAVLSLSEKDAAAGVVTHSSGNHAVALARAAKIRGIAAHIVMPANSATNKLAAVRAFGVEPSLCKPTAEARQEAANALIERTGATFIHPYDNLQVMAGQGTVAIEVMEQLAEFDALIVPVGGGGLLSGCLTAMKSRQPKIEVLAAEPEWADDAKRSLASGQIEMPTRYDTIADGLRTPLGELTFPIIRDRVDDILLASEDNIRAATESILRQARLVAEPSGAVSLAALSQHRSRFAGRRVVLVISGGNLNFPTPVVA